MLPIHTKLLTPLIQSTKKSIFIQKINISYTKHQKLYKNNESYCKYSYRRNLSQNQNYFFQRKSIFTTSHLEKADVTDFFNKYFNEIKDLKKSSLITDTSEDDELINLSFTMEQDIKKYFLSQGISYKEFETSYMTMCPTYSIGDQQHNLFIDKNSGNNS